MPPLTAAEGKYVSSFAGFFPADRPEYLALIIVDEPQGTYYGSAVAAPVAKEIFDFYHSFKHFGKNIRSLFTYYFVFEHRFKFFCFLKT